MEMRDAIELEKQWGDKLCTHSSLAKEYEL